MAICKVERNLGAVSLSLETGRIAKQADGSVVARIGDTMILATVCGGTPREGIDFFPLTVEYIAKTYAAGKIPGGFFKREGKPSEKEVLSARLIDRSIRPLFPKTYVNEVQVIVTLISADDEYDGDILGITAASCALMLSSIPFAEPVAGVRVGMVDGKLKVYPTLAETETGELDMIVAGTENSIMMVEGGAIELKESVILEAIALAHEEIKKIVAMQKELVAQTGTVKPVYVAPEPTAGLRDAVEALVKDRIHELSFNGQKKARYTGVGKLLEEVQAALAPQFPEKVKEIAKIFHELETEDIRRTILEQGTRIGGRDYDTIRDITCELDILPRAHGSSLFTRGETQAMVAVTLGTKMDEQKIDYIQGEYEKSYMFHYNFPPFCVGEVKRLGSVSRREIGHGHLAERSLSPVLPSEKSFPYTIRIVSEITESNGSSSMASVCGASLSLMAAGVPIKCHVAGVAMGLIKQDDKIAVLTDILGTEDHCGDMDFKVTGTKDGVTGIQMDIKIHGITQEIMKLALEKALQARCRIIETMEQTIPKSRTQLSPYAPLITIIQIEKDKIREIIGPGGKVIREIQEKTGTIIEIEDDGSVHVAGANGKATAAAVKIIKDITAEPEIGAVYDAVVKTIVDFGAFVEFMPGREGLVHISELENHRVNRVEDVLNLGDTVKVKLIGVERNGKLRLSRKAALPQQPQHEE